MAQGGLGSLWGAILGAFGAGPASGTIEAITGTALEALLGPSLNEAKQYAQAYIETPKNHDLERSLRFAALLACLHLILEQNRLEEAEGAMERGKPRDTFCPAARKWVHGQLFALGQVQDGAHRESVATYQASLNTALASQPNPRDAARAAQDRKTAEENMWQELRAALQNQQFPTDFEARFKGEGGHGWFGYFIIFLREALKNQDNARHAFFIGGLSDLQNAVTRIEAAQARLEAKVDQLPSAQDNVQALMAALAQSGVLARVEAQGLAERFIFSLAARLNPEIAGNLEQAQREIEAVVDTALDIQRRGLSPGSNEDAFITQVLAEVARRNQEGSLDAGAAAVDAGLAQLAQLENAQQEELRRKRITLLETGIEQDLLRRDAPAVAKRVETLVALEVPNRPAWAPAFMERGDGFYETGRDKGINLPLEVAIAMAQRMLATAETGDERGTALNLLGTALQTLGAREAGTARLEEAVTAYREALRERTRDRVPLDWAATQNNLGNALRALGAGEAGTARLEEAVTAFREALEERTRDRVPRDWATTQNNLGAALWALGRRVAGTVRLEEAVTAHREALKECTRDSLPLQWATTQNNLGVALSELGEREPGTERLEEAVTAYREAIKERTRDSVPLDWATTQNNLGNALQTLGAREAGTARLEEAVTAYREALKEYTRDRVPLHWAMTQNNLGAALSELGEREAGTARLEDAVTAYREALEERTRDRVPLDWAYSQHGLANCLATLAERSPTPGPILADAITHMQNAVDGYQQVGDKYWGPIAEQRLAELKAKAQ
jgi:tetratricopeptide (TPR) repeat protein